ncbi:MAG: OmpA family protein [Oxalobacter sp.]|nr:MAG: OmpA family protein [Oxalobacter sp.]
MKKIFKLTLIVSAIVATSAFAQQAGDIKAKTPYSAYVQDARGVVARSANGLCWRTGYWTPADAIPACEGGAPVAVAEPEDIVLGADGLFDTNKAVLKPVAQAKLDKLAEDMKRVNVESIIVTGHTDSRGADAYNQKLSERRAEAVKAYLVAKGVDGKKITTKGMGESQPVADNATEAGRLKNRRVAIKVVGEAK